MEAFEVSAFVGEYATERIPFPPLLLAHTRDGDFPSAFPFVLMSRFLLHLLAAQWADIDLEWRIFFKLVAEYLWASVPIVLMKVGFNELAVARSVSPQSEFLAMLFRLERIAVFLQRGFDRKRGLHYLEPIVLLRKPHNEVADSLVLNARVEVNARYAVVGQRFVQ